MRLPLRCAPLVLGWLILTSCSHNVTTDLPAAPTPVRPTVRITKLIIAPPGGGSMIVGTVVPITTSGPPPSDGLALGAFAQYSDGSGHFVEATWSSSDDGIALVRNGELVAINRGTAVLTASAEGLTASETFIVDPGIPGLWVGTYVVDSCQAGSGSVDALVCAAPTPGHAGGILRVGTVAPMALQITQHGKDLSATMQFGELRGTLTGVDAGANYLSLSGTLNASTSNAKIVVFNARVKQDVMEGVMGYELRITDLPSWAVVTAHFDSIARK